MEFAHVAHVYDTESSCCALAPLWRVRLFEKHGFRRRRRPKRTVSEIDTYALTGARFTDSPGEVLTGAGTRHRVNFTIISPKVRIESHDSEAHSNTCKIQHNDVEFRSGLCPPNVSRIGPGNPYRRRVCPPVAAVCWPEGVGHKTKPDICKYIYM